MNQHSEKLSALEDSAVGREDDSKDAAFWQDFAARARLLSIATALLTRRAEALGDAAPDAAEAKRVARAAGEYIVPRLANPVVKIPSKLFREQFFDVFAVGKPRVARTTAFFTAKVDAFGSYVDDLQDSFGIGKKKNPTFKEAVGFAGSKEASDIVKETVGVTGRIEVRVTHDSVVSKKKDARPWLNDPKTTIELRLPANATFRLILDLAARQNAIGAEARSYQETFRQIAEKVTGQAANLDTPPALELAAEFFTAAAKVYTLAAMAA